MYKNLIIAVSFVLIFSGCAALMDSPKNIIGFSKRDLEAARENSSYQVYQAQVTDVFNAVVEELNKVEYTIFTKDEIEGFIVVMGIPKVVNTTEVGVFITTLDKGQGVKVELSSRSTPARKIVAATLFSVLSDRFKKK